jgi:hypothetical protein
VLKAAKGEERVHDWIFLAMALYRAGETAEARRYLEKVVKHKAGGNEQGWANAEIEILRAEAEAMVK